MMKRLHKLLVVLALAAAAWALFVLAEGVRLVGSTDPAATPLLTLGGEQRADVCARYDSIGFTQYYALGWDDVFCSGEFRVLGVTVASW